MCPLYLSNFVSQHWNDLEQVAYNAVGSDFKNRRVGVAVDGNDDIRILHTHQMLNRS